MNETMNTKMDVEDNKEDTTKVENNEEKNETEQEKSKKDDEIVETVKEEKPKRKTRYGTRKRKSEATKSIDAAYYLGYVEELETVDMIMKKFEKLEEMKNLKKKSSDKDENQSGDKEDLNEKELEDLFKATSTFTVEAVSKQTESVHVRQAYDEEFGYDGYDEDGWGLGGVTTHENEEGEAIFLFGDGTDDDLWDEIFNKKSKKRSGSRRSRVEANRGVTQIAFVSDVRGQYVTALKKVRRVDPNAIHYQRIPSEPLPQSWAKRIKPYVPVEKRTNFHTEWKEGMIVHTNEFHKYGDAPVDSMYFETPDIFKFNLVEIAKKRGGFNGIFLDPPWKEPRQLPPGKEFSEPDTTKANTKLIEPEDLAKLNLKSRELLKSGFIFIWTPKHLLSRVLSVLEKMDFHYVENAVYVKHHVENTMASQDCAYFRQSKETLLICRRGVRSERNGKITWAPVEIRHQRTSDVHYDFLRYDDKSAFDSGSKQSLFDTKPTPYVHNMVETMLPHARYNNKDSSEKVEESGQSETPEEINDAKKKRTNGQLLHLWSAKDVQRTGWTSIVELTKAN